MPALKDLVNNLSNFKYYSGVGTFSANKVPYGRDTVTGGDSGQPYVVSTAGDINVFGTKPILNDVKRISKFLTDKSRGVEFTLKQVGLQLMNPQLENRTRDTSKPTKGQGVLNNVGNFLSNEGNRILNNVGPTRIYNPLNTNLLAQVAGSALGTHIVRHGLTLEVREEDKYTSIVKANNESGNNRLINLTNKLATSPLTGGDTLFSYTGGPNSFLGLGKTEVKRAEGLNTFTALRFNQNKNLLNGFVPIVSSDILNIDANGYLNNEVVDGETGLKTNTSKSFDFRNNDFRAYKKLQDPTAYTNPQLQIQKSLATPSQLADLNQQEVRITDYSKYNKYDRIGVINSNNKRFNTRRHDGINMVSLYYGSGLNGLRKDLKDINDLPIDEKNIRDLIKFRIKSLNNDKPGDGVFMVFRAFFNGAITDSIDANWKPITYAGRGESFYGYEGTTANMTFSFTIMAFSRAEMKPLYQKLNYLKSTLYPDYRANRMRGNLSELTIGDYVKYQPGIITGMTITIPEDANWEIAMNEPDNVLGNLDADMHELPMMVRVDMNFIPIYNFLPRKSAEAPFIGLDSLSPNDNIRTNNTQEWLKGANDKLK